MRIKSMRNKSIRNLYFASSFLTLRKRIQCAGNLLPFVMPAVALLVFAPAQFLLPSEVHAQTNDCSPGILIEKKTGSAKETDRQLDIPAKEAGVGKDISGSVDRALSGLDTFALAFKILPMPNYPPGSFSESTEICRFNGYGSKANACELPQERCFRQIAAIPESGMVYAIGTGPELFSITVDNKTKESLEPVSLQSLTCVDKDGTNIVIPKIKKFHGIAYDSKRKRLLIVAQVSGFKEILLSYERDQKKVQVLKALDNIEAFSQEHTCLSYDEAKDRLYSVVGGFKGLWLLEELSAAGELIGSTELKPGIENSSTSKNGLQLFVREGKAIVFAPHSEVRRIEQKEIKPSRVYVYDLNDGQLLFQKGLTGVQI